MAGKRKSPETGGSGYIVAVAFRDINDWNKVYSIGDDASHFDDDRLLSLIEKNYVTESTETSGKPE